MNQQYIYPQNLKSQAKLWMWSLRDIAIIGISLIISILTLSQIKLYLPLAVTLVFVFLTIRLEEQTVLDFICRCYKYFISSQQYIVWQEKSVGQRTIKEKDGNNE